MYVLLAVITTGISPFYVGWRERKNKPLRLEVRIGSERPSRLFRAGLGYHGTWYLGFVGEREPLEFLLPPKSRRKLEGKEPYE